ncbi:MAG: methanogenesis marker 6 protein [Candidatus Nezhaarchaeota archaeon]|nr:methanogenesis marker 6 protein [Candidatus Nezhaarchaeota archaeon]
MKKTFMIVVNPDSDLSPEKLFDEVLSLDADASVKCTCFGVLIEGEEEEVSKILKYVREKYPYDTFVKLRGYPINDRRVCRAHRGGGPRPGFHQLDAEFRLLPLIAYALKDLSLEEGKEPLPVPESKPLKAEEVKKVVEEVLGSGA